jgi:ectoine hydroxylase-related dioxygenase (phytanoyl-CoA dioxygenase family)
MGMLTREHLAQYENEGYTVVPEFLSQPDADAILAEIERIKDGATVAHHNAERLEMEPNQGPDGNSVRRIYEPCTYYPSFLSFSESSKTLDVLEQLVGPDIYFHYSKINMKPSRLGSIVEWHQDLTCYPHSNTDCVAVLFYLNDADRSNGCLQVIPGAHRQKVLDHTTRGLFQGKVTEAVDNSKAVFLEAKAGSAIFMHCLTPHASAPNLSAKPRTTLILAYRAADAYPVYLRGKTEAQETHARLVRGREASAARFTLHSFPIPRFPKAVKSLYELQELSRKRA